MSIASRLRSERLLAAHPFSRGIDPDELARMSELAYLVDFDTGDVIFAIDDEAERFYLLRSGVVGLEVPSDTGIPRTIEQITEGSALGWSWLFPPYQWQFAAVARTPVRTIAFDAPTLRAHLEERPVCGFAVLSRVAMVMADRLYATRRQVLSLLD